jgi:putative membrane protein
LTDPEIASVALTANMGEIEQGDIAETKAQNPAVVALATMLVDMHTAAEQRENALATTLSITPQDNAISSQLRSASSSIVMQLNSASTGDFDAVYVRAQVQVHEQVLDTIDNVLLPDVTNAMLRAELMTTRGEVESHLTAARALAATLDIDTDAGI